MSLSNFLFVIALLAAGICSHVLLIDLIPFLAVRRFTAKVLPEWNTIIHTKPVSWRMREVVMPCPDLIYSMMKYDLNAGRAIRIRLEDDTYQNLGFYDRNARCVQTKSYLDKGGLIIAVDEASAAKLSDEAIVAQVADSATATVVRLPATTGYLLYRILVVNRSAISRTIATQKSMAIGVVPFVSGTAGNRSVRLVDHTALILGSLIVSVFVAGVGLELWSGNRSVSELCVDFAGATSFGVLTAIIAARYFRSTATVGKGVDDVNVGPWSITYMQPQQSRLNPYAYLRFFFHGALGLPGSEVVYATAIRDSAGEKLLSEHSYVVEAPTVDFRCSWWSITVYAHDKFLVQNDSDVYSVVSTSLVNPTNRFKVCLSRSNTQDQGPYASLPWIPLASGPAKEFRLIFRAYLPDQSAWSPTAVQSLPLPAITRID